MCFLAVCLRCSSGVRREGWRSHRMCYEAWLESEHKGMRMQMRSKALIARIAELACVDGEWMQNRDASGNALKTSCEKWCPTLQAYRRLIFR